MYTEGFEGLEETEREPRRTYVSGTDTDRLLRENEKLKKSLEKEQFFNKLLDQEIQELKMNSPAYGKQEFRSDYWAGNRGVSRGAFYLLLVITLLLAGYIGYGIYYDKPFNYLGIGKAVPPVAHVTPPQSPAPKEETPAVVAPTAATKDSVPNIIGDQKVAPPPVTSVSEKPKASQKAAVTTVADEEYNEEEVNRALEDDRPRATPPAAAKPVDENPRVIARYKVTSKANFYNSPDENSMRGTFIAGDLNKTVSAIEEKNGFIYVVYTNDLGFTSRGWLSKQDLTKE